VILRRRCLVHHDVVGSGGCAALDQAVGGELPVGIEREAEGRGAAPADRVPVAGHELGVALDVAVDVGDPRQTRHHGGDRLGNRSAVVAAADRGSTAVAEGRVAADLEADVLVGGADQVVERAVERVAEHERPGHEGHAEHDRHRRQREAQLAGAQALEGDSAHGQLPSVRIRSSTESAVG
jgi:hypothetical protein